MKSMIFYFAFISFYSLNAQDYQDYCFISFDNQIIQLTINTTEVSLDLITQIDMINKTQTCNLSEIICPQSIIWILLNETEMFNLYFFMNETTNPDAYDFSSIKCLLSYLNYSDETN